MLKLSKPAALLLAAVLVAATVVIQLVSMSLALRATLGALDAGILVFGVNTGTFASLVKLAPSIVAVIGAVLTAFAAAVAGLPITSAWRTVLAVVTAIVGVLIPGTEPTAIVTTSFATAPVGSTSGEGAKAMGDPKNAAQGPGRKS